MPNREQRRKMAKKMNTPQKLERLVDEIVKERTKDMKKDFDKKMVDYLEVMVVMTAYVLNLEDVESDRISKIIARIMMNIDSFRTGELAPGDYDLIKKEVEDLGVKI